MDSVNSGTSVMVPESRTALLAAQAELFDEELAGGLLSR
jgi:hypothetical protein